MSDADDQLARIVEQHRGALERLAKGPQADVSASQLAVEWESTARAMREERDELRARLQASEAEVKRLLDLERNAWRRYEREKQRTAEVDAELDRVRALNRHYVSKWCEAEAERDAAKGRMAEHDEARRRAYDALRGVEATEAAGITGDPIVDGIAALRAALAVAVQERDDAAAERDAFRDQRDGSFEDVESLNGCLERATARAEQAEADLTAARALLRECLTAEEWPAGLDERIEAHLEGR